MLVEDSSRPPHRPGTTERSGQARGGPPRLLEVPPGRLGRSLHREVFGALPVRTAEALDVPEVAAAVRPLLAAGWRPAQLAARVAALPLAADAPPAVVAFLEHLHGRARPWRPGGALPERSIRPGPPCAACGETSAFFVTRRVRLCTFCVAALEAGAARLVPVVPSG